jgi:hypothetical protein
MSPVKAGLFGAPNTRNRNVLSFPYTGTGGFLRTTESAKVDENENKLKTMFCKKCEREVVEEEVEIKQKIDDVRFLSANGASIQEGEMIFRVRVHIDCGSEIIN